MLSLPEEFFMHKELTHIRNSFLMDNRISQKSEKREKVSILDVCSGEPVIYII